MAGEQTVPGRLPLATLLREIAGLFGRGAGMLTAGDMAGLRRMDPRKIDSPGFYKLAATVLDRELPTFGKEREERETRWAAVIVGLAHLGELHRPGVRFGAALVDAEFAESRFVRLLRADAERLVDEVPSVARFLVAKSTPVDFTDAARLLLSAGRRDEERVRRGIARDYYGALNRKSTQ